MGSFGCLLHSSSGINMDPWDPLDVCYIHQVVKKNSVSYSIIFTEQHTENKWKKKVSEIEGHKVNLANKVEELTLRVSDLEGSELTLKRKLKVGST